MTLGTILMAQRAWGRVRTATFLRRIGAPSTVLTKRVETLTDRQRAILVRGLVTHLSPPAFAQEWW